MSAETQRAPRRVRSFALSVLPGDEEAFGFELEELVGEERAPSGLKLHLNPARARRVMESVLAAAKASGHAKSAVGGSRKRPLPLSEEAGVRLGLVFLTTAPLRKSRRVDAIARALAGMATEEAYYWYAQCVGPEALRARRALRLLLAEE